MLNRSGKVVVLMIGPVAPPLGGMATSMNILASSALKGEFDIRIFDVVGYRTRKGGNAFVGAIYQLYLVFKLMAVLIRDNPKIVHVHMTSYFYFYRRFIDMSICKIFGKKIIVHLRSGKFERFYSEGNGFVKYIIRVAFRLSDINIVLSEYWRAVLSKISPPGKIVVINNGVNSVDFRSGKNIKMKWGLSEEHIVVLFTGNIGRRKGVVDLLKSVPMVTKHIRDITFLILGPQMEDGDRSLFDRVIKENNIGPYVRYEESVGRPEIFDYYASSDIFVLPSYAENFPNSIIEAMAAGIPVVVSDVGAIPEIVEDGTGGFIVKPGDIPAIADRIVKLASNPGLRKEMGLRNSELVKEKYELNIITDKIAALYRTIAGVTT